MALAVVHSRALAGVSAVPVEVEVHLSGGLPNMSIVGLPEAAVKESKDRVRAAIQNSRFEFPQRRITVNLAPADLPKEGGRYDLPIALGILAASGQLPLDSLEQHEFVGELALSGELRVVRGSLPTSLSVAATGRRLIVPLGNGAEAAIPQQAQVYAAASLLDVCAHLHGQQALPLQSAPTRENYDISQLPDLLDVKGQYQAKRALEVAAAGRHNLVMLGPPGTGKSMLAARLPGLLPPLDDEAALAAAAIASISDQGFNPRQWRVPPFRSPHHTSSGVALVGGGSIPRPGEISLAHQGVLFLDELTEYDRQVLDVLREPMETGHITISRAARQADFPADFQLVAAMNPCPCGDFGDPGKSCRCTPTQIARYRGKLSGPFMDRIDLQIEVPRVARELLRGQDPGAESSAVVRSRVLAARDCQFARSGKPNARLNSRELEQVCRLQPQDAALLDQVMTRLRLSARAYHRILKVARTLADLTGSLHIETPHLSEAIAYRALDRGNAQTAALSA